MGFIKYTVGRIRVGIPLQEAYEFGIALTITRAEKDAEKTKHTIGTILDDRCHPVE